MIAQAGLAVDEWHKSDESHIVFEEGYLHLLKTVKARLYREKALTPDERRDLAQKLDLFMDNLHRGC